MDNINDFGKSLPELLFLGNELNELLDSYYDLTWDIKLILDQDLDEGIEKIQNILSQREKIQESYNEIMLKYSQYSKEYSNNELQQIDNSRKESLLSINKINNEISSRLNKEYKEYQARLNNIQTGKLLHNTYDNNQTTAWGTYFDKKK